MKKAFVRRAAILAALSIAAAACGSGTDAAKPAATTSSTAKANAATTTTDSMDGMDGMDHSMEGMDHGNEGEDHDDAAAKSHHHDDSTVTYEKLNATTKAEVDVIIQWAAKYKTGADAKKDGWTKATKSLYGIGAHWLRGGVAGFTGGDGGFNIKEPNVLLFDGEGDDANLAGVSWILSAATNPEGFTGPDDSWHRHSSVCFSEGLVISEGEADPTCTDQFETDSGRRDKTPTSDVLAGLHLHHVDWQDNRDRRLTAGDRAVDGFFHRKRREEKFRLRRQWQCDHPR